MTLTGKTIKRAAAILAASLGLTVLALPAGISHAAVVPSNPTSSPFVLRIVQGPDAGRVLEGTLILRVSNDLQVHGVLVTGPVVPAPGTPVEATTVRSAGAPALALLQSRSLTTEAVVPVTGQVFPASHSMGLTFALGSGRSMRALLTGSPALRQVAGTGPQATVQTSGPRRGDVAGAYIIHIHIQGNGWSIDIYI